MRYEVRPFAEEHLDDAARLVAERMRYLRRQVFALDRRYEDPAAVRDQVAGLFARDGASGAIVLIQGRATAFVLGSPRSSSAWGPNVWIEDAGSGGSDPEATREAYAAAAGPWVEQGWTSHYVVIPATDERVRGGWFSLGFGQQQIHALREPVWREFEPSLAAGLAIRRATRDDLPTLAELDVALPRHQAGSPVFSTLALPTVEEALAEIESDFDDTDFFTFVAEYQGQVVGAAIACSLELSPGHTPLMRPRSAGFMAYVVVLPGARGLGAGRALGETILAWSRDEGYEWVASDWRATNIEANRTWSALGFKPSFYRLHRAIA